MQRLLQRGCLSTCHVIKRSRMTIRIVEYFSLSNNVTAILLTQSLSQLKISVDILNRSKRQKDWSDWSSSPISLVLCWLHRFMGQGRSWRSCNSSNGGGELRTTWLGTHGFRKECKRIS